MKKARFLTPARDEAGKVYLDLAEERELVGIVTRDLDDPTLWVARVAPGRDVLCADWQTAVGRIVRTATEVVEER